MISSITFCLSVSDLLHLAWHSLGSSTQRELSQAERSDRGAVQSLRGQGPACLPWMPGLAKAPQSGGPGASLWQTLCFLAPGAAAAELRMGDWGAGAGDSDTLEAPGHGPGSPQRRRLSRPPSESEPAIVRATRDWEASRSGGRGAAERRGVTLLVCSSVIRLLVTTLSRGPAGDRCAPEEGLPASNARPGFSRPAPLEPAALLAAPPGERLQMERSGCLFCFGGRGVSEPRTYLSNEVVITPGLANGMKTRSSAKATDGPACA